MECCPTEATGSVSKSPASVWFGIAMVVVAISYLLAISGLVHDVPYINSFSHSVMEISNTVWWGVLIGILCVGMLEFIPQEFILSLFGKKGTSSGLVRAVLAGVALDLCSHGILFVGAKLYKKGVPLAQLMAFLIASPWNSLSLTFVLISLIGLKWTLLFILLSIILAFLSGMIFNFCITKGWLRENPNYYVSEEKIPIKTLLKSLHFHPWRVIKHGVSGAYPILGWLVIGIIFASLIRTFIPSDMFSEHFGPTLLGMVVTLLLAVIIEVCSEGATPMAADIITRAGALGNGFVFLMAGVATDYTEIMVLRQVTGSWKTSLFLPLVTVPQIVIVGWILNHFII